MGSRDMGSEGMNFSSVQAVPASSSSSESSASLVMTGVLAEKWFREHPYTKKYETILNKQIK